MSSNRSRFVKQWMMYFVSSITLTFTLWCLPTKMNITVNVVSADQDNSNQNEAHNENTADSHEADAVESKDIQQGPVTLLLPKQIDILKSSSNVVSQDKYLDLPLFPSAPSVNTDRGQVSEKSTPVIPVVSREEEPEVEPVVSEPAAADSILATEPAKETESETVAPVEETESETVAPVEEVKTEESSLIHEVEFAPEPAEKAEDKDVIVESADSPSLQADQAMIGSVSLGRDGSLLKILKILNNDGQVANYMRHWYRTMNNDHITAVNLLQDFYHDNTILVSASYDSNLTPLVASYDQNIVLHYGVLNAPGNYDSGSKRVTEDYNFFIPEHDVDMLSSSGKFSINWLSSYNDSVKLAVGPYIETSKSSVSDDTPSIISDNNSIATGLDIFAYVPLQDKVSFAFGKTNFHFSRNYVKNSHVIMDINFDKGSYYNNFSGGFYMGFGRTFTFSKNQQLSALASFGITSLYHKEYEIYWNKMYNLSFVHITQSEDLYRKDWHIKVDRSHFNYMPISLALQWSNNSVWLSENKQLVGITPQLMLGLSVNLLKSHDKEYDVHVYGKWSDLDGILHSYPSTISDVKTTIAKKLPEVSPWMFYGQISLNVITEIIPNSRIFLIFGVNQKQVTYRIGASFSIKL